MRTSAMHVWCDACGREVELLEIERVAAAARLDIAALLVLMARSGAHVVETRAGVDWICSAWLSRAP